MVKPVVFVGDLHLSDRQISTRVDDSTETCLEKFEWILNYAASIGADCIHTGDMFSHTLFSNRTRYRIKKALSAYRDKGFVFASISGNHCVSGSSMVLTSTGWCSLGTLIGKDVSLWDGMEFVEGKVASYGVQNVVRLKFYSGREVVCTPDHRFKVLTRKGFDWVEAQNLTSTDRVCTSLKPVRMPGQWLQDGTYTSGHPNCVPFVYDDSKRDALAYVVGVLLGDGYIADRRDSGRGCDVSVAIGKNDIPRGYYDTLCSCLKVLGINYSYRQDYEFVGSVNIHSVAFYDFLIEQVGWVGTCSTDKELPSSIWHAPESVKKMLLTGLVRSDGSWGEYRLRMTAKNLIYQVGLLASELGCVVYYSDWDNEGYSKLPNEDRYIHSQAHVYNVSFGGASWLFNNGDSSGQGYMEKVQIAPRGFEVDWGYYRKEYSRVTHDYANRNVLACENRLNIMGTTLGEYYGVDVVLSIEDAGEEEVFCPSVNSIRHQFSAEGIIVHNSGDVADRDPNSVIYRELGQFCLDGYVDFLGAFEEMFTDYTVGEFGVIRGYSAYSELNTSNADEVIGIVSHHWVATEAFGDPLVVYPDDMKKVFPNLAFLVSGHVHDTFAPYESRDGVSVVRPGSVMRTDAGISSDRVPQVAVLRVEDGGGYPRFLWNEVPIACARPYAEVFYSEKRGINADSANALDRFVRQMQSQSGAVMDINSAISEQYTKVPAADRDMVKADLVSQGYAV